MSVQCTPVFQLTCLYMLLIKEVIGKRENFNPLFLGWNVQTQTKPIHMQSICSPSAALLGSWSIYVHHIHCPHTHTHKQVCLSDENFFNLFWLSPHSNAFWSLFYGEKTKDMCPSNFVAFKRVNPQSTLEFVQLPDRRRQNWNKHVPCTYFAFIKRFFCYYYSSWLLLLQQTL
jgi:hypothetical protein